MFAVLCDTADESAVWAAERLRRRLTGVRIVHLDLLAFAPGLTLSVGESAPEVNLPLPDGGLLSSSTSCAVLNRAYRPPRPSINITDSSYAQEEMHAITMALLATFGPRVVNAPHRLGLAGAEYGPALWLRLAALAGLPISPWSIDALTALPPVKHRALVLGPTVFGLQGELATGARSLARLAGAELLGLGLSAAGQVVEVTTMPDLSLAGEEGADALAALLAGRLEAGWVAR